MVRIDSAAGSVNEDWSVSISFAHNAALIAALLSDSP
jgi:hypothetical protein